MMINIRPVSDLRNKYSEIENTIQTSGRPVFLTKNGYGSMVVMSIEQYAALTDDVEMKLLQADRAAENTDERYTAQEVFENARKRIHG